MAKSEDEILELFKAAVLEVDAKKKVDRVDLDMELSELGLDSIQTMEVIGTLEERLNITLPDEELNNLRRVRDLTALVRRIA